MLNQKMLLCNCGACSLFEGVKEYHMSELNFESAAVVGLNSTHLNVFGCHYP
jgi:hypothetical protein